MDKLETKLSDKQLEEIKDMQFSDIVTYLSGLNEKVTGLGFAQLDDMAEEKKLSPCTVKMIREALINKSKIKK